MKQAKTRYELWENYPKVADEVVKERWIPLEVAEQQIQKLRKEYSDAMKSNAVTYEARIEMLEGRLERIRQLINSFSSYQKNGMIHEWFERLEGVVKNTKEASES